MVTSINAKRNRELSNKINSIWDEMENKFKRHDEIEFDKDMIFEELYIPKVVDLKQIHHIGTYNGRKQRGNTTYYIGYFYNREDNKIYSADCPLSKLHSYRNHGGEYIASSLIELFRSEIDCCTRWIDEAEFERNYDDCNFYIHLRNIVIEEFMRSGLERSLIEIEVNNAKMRFGLEM